MSKETPHICTTVKLLKPAILGTVPKIRCLPQQGKHLGGSKPSRNKWRCLDFFLQTLLSIIVPWERAPVTPKQSSLQRYSEGSRWSQSLRSWDEFLYSCRQVFIYFLGILTGKSVGVSERRHPGYHPSILLPLPSPPSSQTRWESSKKRAGSPLPALPTRLSTEAMVRGRAAGRLPRGPRTPLPPRSGTSGHRCWLLLLRSPISLGHLYNIFNIQQLFCCWLHWNNLGRIW